MKSFSTPLEALTEKHTSVLAIGLWQHAEFAIVWGQIGETGSWAIAPDCETASELLTRNTILPELILLAAPLPASFRQLQIETLRRLSPLAQIVVVAGTWCEGELRTGKPHLGVLRVYWHEFASWWSARVGEIHVWSSCLDGPLTPRSYDTVKNLEFSIAIHTQTLAAFEAIAATLSPYGATCEWVRDSHGLDSAKVGIWDGGQLDAKEWQQLQVFASKLHATSGSLIVLLDFPRKEHIQRLQEISCKAVLGKPYVVAELVDAITQLSNCGKHGP